jgi:V8-like Glu-specific endopeptidase
LTHSSVLDSIIDKGLFYDIDTSSGQSGAPVYITSENKRNIIKLVGIQKSYWPRKRLSFATMITGEVITVLQDWAR